LTYDIVHHPEQEELAIDEALCRLVTAFPRVLVDRPRGVALRRSWGPKCGSYSRIDPANYCNPGYEIRAAWVSITVEDGSDPVEFVLEHELEFFFKHSSEECRQLRRPTIQRVADALGYAVSEWPLFMDVIVKYGNGWSGIAGELTLNWRLGEALSRYRLYPEEVDFGAGCVNLTVIVDDDEIRKQCLEDAVHSVLPDAIIEFAFRPDALPRCS
jgi:hypothetical protein